MNLADGLRINSWSNPEKVAAVFEDKQVTYEQLNKRANRLSHAVIKRGFKRQDKISIVMYNNIEFLEIYHGLARANIISVPINFRLVSSELEYVINNSDSTALFIGVELFPNVHLENLPNIKPENIFIVGPRDKTPEGFINYEELLAAQPDFEPTGVDQKEDDIFLLRLHFRNDRFSQRRHEYCAGDPGYR